MKEVLRLGHQKITVRLPNTTAALLYIKAQSLNKGLRDAQTHIHPYSTSKQGPPS